MTDPQDRLQALLDGREIDRREIPSAVSWLVDPATSDTARVAFLVALRAKGETTAEVLGFARELRRTAEPFVGPRKSGAVDLCGSGGARLPSFNVGTVSALVVRATGVPVAKHGNRSARGAEGGWSGSTDLLEALGLPYDRSRAFARASFRREKITFLHAPLYHPSTRQVAAARRALGLRTIFNELGPLTNPARVTCQIAGCASVQAALRLVAVLPALGVSRGIAVTSSDGADEFSPKGRSRYWRWVGRRHTTGSVDPSRLLEKEDRRGSWAPLPAPEAAEETRRILAGGGGARRGSILLTAGAALWARGRAASLKAGVDRASAALDSGSAEALLHRLTRLAGSRRWEAS